MQPDTIYDAGMGINIIDNHIVSAYQCINDGEHSLITEVQDIGRFFLYKIGKFGLQFQMFISFSRHSARAHGIEHAVLCCCFGVSSLYFRVVAESQIVVGTPEYDFFSLKNHSRADGAFKSWEYKISFSVISKLSERTWIMLDSVKNIYHWMCNLFCWGWGITDSKNLLRLYQKVSCNFLVT